MGNGEDLKICETAHLERSNVAFLTMQPVIGVCFFSHPPHMANTQQILGDRVFTAMFSNSASLMVSASAGSLLCLCSLSSFSIRLSTVSVFCRCSLAKSTTRHVFISFHAHAAPLGHVFENHAGPPAGFIMFGTELEKWCQKTLHCALVCVENIANVKCVGESALSPKNDERCSRHALHPA